MSLSLSSSISSAEDEKGILDDLVGSDDNDKEKSGNPENKQTENIRTRQRKRGSFVVSRNQPKPKKHADDAHRLFEKRLYTYPTASSSSLRQSIAMSTAETARQPKSVVEKAVLSDCIKNHFLLACNTISDFESGPETFSSDVMVGALISRFERVSLRKNEILFEEGSDADYLYVLYEGEVLLRSRDDQWKIPLIREGEEKKRDNDDDRDEGYSDDDTVKYKIFGELELLTNSSFYKATAKAVSETCVLFRLGANDFQTYFVPQHKHHVEHTQLGEEEKLLRLLRNALPEELSSYFFQDDDEDYEYNIELLKRLLSERKVRNFQKGDVLIHKNTTLHSLVIVTDGVVRASDNSAGGRCYEDILYGPGNSRNSFGWQSVLKMGTNDNSLNFSANDSSHEPGLDHTVSLQQDMKSNMRGTIRAETDGQAILISKKSFEKIFCHICYNHEHGDKHHHHDGRPLLLDVADLRWRRWKRTQLQHIMVFKDSGLNRTQINGLLDLMHSREYDLEETIFQAGQKVEAAMYFVRKGSVRLVLNRGREKKMVEMGGYFGEKSMLLDQNKSDSEKNHQKRAVMSAISASASTKVDVLYLEECRKIVNTTMLGLGMNSSVTSIDPSIQWADLKRHKLIGTGSFGQVWLASIDPSDNSEGEASARRFFALKVQAKYPLIRSGNADRLIGERNVMASLHSPFIMRLFNAFQDDYRLYMITSLLSGGELESRLPETGFSEKVARFYAAGILEALTYMHRKHILHRDVKTENVLLNEKGYPVLIDLGFGKS